MIKKLISVLAACSLALAMSTAAFADEGKEKDKEKDETAEGYDAEQLTDEPEPAISFDGDGYESYIHLTKDADKAGITFEPEKDVTYQGRSLRISAAKGVEGYFSMSGVVKDVNNNIQFPDAPEREDSSAYSTVGVAVYAKDFGLPSFDGCFISFAYRMTADDKTALQGKSVYVYGADEKGIRVGDGYTVLTYDDVLNDNVSKFNPMGTFSLPAEAGAAMVIFDIPVMNSVNGPVLYLDNIMIQLPDSAGDLSYVRNIDGFNRAAEKREGSDAIQVKKQKTDLGTSADKVKTDKRQITPAGIAVIVFLGLLVVGGIVFAVMRMKRRFY